MEARTILKQDQHLQSPQLISRWRRSSRKSHKSRFAPLTLLVLAVSSTTRCLSKAVSTSFNSLRKSLNYIRAFVVRIGANAHCFAESKSLQALPILPRSAAACCYALATQFKFARQAGRRSHRRACMRICTCVCKHIQASRQAVSVPLPVIVCARTYICMRTHEHASRQAGGERPPYPSPCFSPVQQTHAALAPCRSCWLQYAPSNASWRTHTSAAKLLRGRQRCAT